MENKTSNYVSVCMCIILALAVGIFGIICAIYGQTLEHRIAGLAINLILAIFFIIIFIYDMGRILNKYKTKK
jgi:hypothetical protein